MKTRLFSAIVFVLALALAASAQDANQRGVRGGRAGQGGWGGGMGMGDGITGTVTEVAADHYTIKTDAGDTYTVHFSVNTRIVKQAIQRRGRRGRRQSSADAQTQRHQGGRRDWRHGRSGCGGQIRGRCGDAQLDPERAKQMREMQGQLRQDLASWER
jgi:hypothetical protein